MSQHPKILPPKTPADLLSYVVTHTKYPTTLVICATKHDFLRALVADIVEQQQPEDQPGQQPDAGTRTASDDDDGGSNHDAATPPHHLTRATLLQTAVSRHARVAFVPTVAHLRAYLSVFRVADARGTVQPPGQEQPALRHRGPPLLLVYGLLELHRGSSEWAAQGLGNSLSTLVDAASGNDLGAAMVEPRVDGRRSWPAEFFKEQVPLANGSSMRADGTWAGRTTELGSIVGRWFRLQSRAEPGQI